MLLQGMYRGKSQKWPYLPESWRWEVPRTLITTPVLLMISQTKIWYQHLLTGNWIFFSSPHRPR